MTLYFLPPPGGWPIAGDRVIPTPRKPRGDVIQLLPMIEPDSRFVEVWEGWRQDVFRSMWGRGHTS